MSQVVVPGSAIVDTASFHAHMVALFGLGPNYGRNLSALEDVLTTEVPRPIKVIWADSAISEARLGPMFAKLRGVFEDVSGADPRFEFELR